jgi:hypothetical protein
MSETVDGDSITVTQASGQKHFVMATSETWQAALNDITAHAQAFQQKFAQVDAQQKMDIRQARHSR